MRLITRNYTLNLKPPESILDPQDVADLTLKSYPALAIDLSPMQVTASCLGHQIEKPTQHQLKAVEIATQLLNYNLSQIVSVCAIRPALLPSDFIDWEQQAKEWQSEHDLNVEDLADLYIQKWQDTIVAAMSVN
jgi:hypothetical protein